jgi:biotin carboxylase
VVKPPDSSGTDNVIVCADAAAVRESAELVLRSANFADVPNRRVLVQGYLSGDEYIVNTVSWDGAHYVTDMWRCAKQRRGSSQVYDREELLPFEGVEQAGIVPYVTSVLDALGIRFGPAHTELIYTPEGPTLLEVGARLHGSFDPAPVAACVDHDHVAATLLAYTRPDELRALCGRPYRLRRRALCVMLISPESGRLEGIPGEAAVRGLPSYFSTLMMVKVGGPIRSTVDLWTCPGMVYLVHADPQVLEEDYRTIRELERQDLFAIA